MEKKVLGKITSAKFGEVDDRPYLMGLLLEFSINGGECHVSNGGKLTVNMSADCGWCKEERQITIEKLMDTVFNILNDAEVCTVDQLRNIPVEITLDGNLFKDFRILTEVL